MALSSPFNKVSALCKTGLTMGPLKSGLASANLATTIAASDCSAAVSKNLAANIIAPSLFTFPASIRIFFCAVGLFAISI